jgi:hypothetical protein
MARRVTAAVLAALVFAGPVRAWRVPSSAERRAIVAAIRKHPAADGARRVLKVRVSIIDRRFASAVTFPRDRAGRVLSRDRWLMRHYAHGWRVLFVGSDLPPCKVASAGIRRELFGSAVCFRRWVADAAKPALWRVRFAGVLGVQPGMTVATVATVARRWHVRFSFSTGSAPGCEIGGFTKNSVEGGALFQDGKFDAVWFSRGVTTPEGVRVGSQVSDLRQMYGARLRHAENLYDPKRPLYYVRGGKPKWFLEFFPDRKGRITTIGFGDRFVLVQEGCN